MIERHVRYCSMCRCDQEHVIREVMSMKTTSKQNVYYTVKADCCQMCGKGNRPSKKV